MYENPLFSLVVDQAEDHDEQLILVKMLIALGKKVK
jgi:hypothetical protein